jgi:hypothetical protein
MAVIFGGLGKGGYLSELHTFDLDMRVLSRGVADGPSARAHPIMFASMSAVFVCGGHCTRTKGDLHSFNFGTMRWRRHPDPESPPRVGTAFCSDGADRHFVFGGGLNLARFCPETGEFVPIAASGTGPDRHLTGFSMALRGSFLFVFGGVRTAGLWGLDLQSQVWAPVFVAPDNRSVTAADGHVNGAGALEIPRATGETMVCSRRDGALWRVLGADSAWQSPIHRLTVGRAVAAIHEAEDMLAMLREF